MGGKQQRSKSFRQPSRACNQNFRKLHQVPSVLLQQRNQKLTCHTLNLMGIRTTFSADEKAKKNRLSENPGVDIPLRKMLNCRDNAFFVNFSAQKKFVSPRCLTVISTILSHPVGSKTCHTVA